MKTEITPTEKVKIMAECVKIAKQLYEQSPRDLSAAMYNNRQSVNTSTEPTLLETAKQIYDWVTE